MWILAENVRIGDYISQYPESEAFLVKDIVYCDKSAYNRTINTDGFYTFIFIGHSPVEVYSKHSVWVKKGLE